MHTYISLLMHLVLVLKNPKVLPQKPNGREFLVLTKNCPAPGDVNLQFQWSHKGSLNWDLMELRVQSNSEWQSLCVLSMCKQIMCVSVCNKRSECISYVG